MSIYGVITISKKDLKIKNLSKYRYRELKYLCLQYNELKEKLRELSLESIKAVQITGMPSAHNISNTTEDIVIKKSEIERKIKAIEQSAIEADGGIYQEILINITEGIAPQYLNIRCSRELFYKKRRLFFSILDTKI